jgi:hypothetical protein
MKKILIYCALLIVAGCSYSVRTSAFPHLKTISIGEFANSTVEYGLEEEISLLLTEKFQNDGRLKIVTMNSDVLLEGEIRDYTDKVFSFDETGAEEYQVRILFKIVFTDLVRNEVVWQQDNLILSEKYSSINEFSEFKTEEEAQTEIFNQLFDTILRNTLEDW